MVLLRRKIAKDHTTRVAYIKKRQADGLPIWRIAAEIGMSKRQIFRILRQEREDSDLAISMVASR